MFRIVFPEISFQGRLSRGAFWRELGIAALMTPFIVGALAALVDGVSNAAGGLHGNHVIVKMLMAVGLALLGVRNFTAMLGVIRRRMNDVGYSSADIYGMGTPALVLIGIWFFAAALPMMFMPLIILATVWLVVSQLRKVATLVFRVTTAPSANAGTIARREAERSSTTTVPKLKEMGTLLRQSPAARLKSERYVARIRELMAAAGSNKETQGAMTSIRKWLDEPAFAADGTAVTEAASKRPPPRGSKSSRASQPRPVPSELNSRHSRHNRRAKPAPTYKRRTRTAAARPAHSLPRTGRATLLGGLLRGPWG